MLNLTPTTQHPIPSAFAAAKVSCPPPWRVSWANLCFLYKHEPGTNPWSLKSYARTQYAKKTVPLEVSEKNVCIYIHIIYIYHIHISYTYIIYIYHIHIHTYTYICIYGPARRPATPPCYPPSTPPRGWLAIYHHPSKSHMLMLYLNAGLVPPMHYMTGYLHAAFTTAYSIAIESIYSVLLPIKYLYSSHILATIKISCAIHTC